MTNVDKIVIDMQNIDSAAEPSRPVATADPSITNDATRNNEGRYPYFNQIVELSNEDRRTPDALSETANVSSDIPPSQSFLKLK